MKKIRLGLFGYGNIARGIEANIAHFDDMEIAAVFTRRDPAALGSAAPAYSVDRLNEFEGKIDVLLMCGGSAKDIPHFAPIALERFNTVDSFDTHAKIPDHFERMDTSGKKHGHLGLISAGWDPGLFSLARLMFSSFLPSGKDYTFWGKGISQGHSDAIRRIEGVADARQYTIPKEDALEAVRRGQGANLTAREKHDRVCYVVAKDGADKAEIERQIVTMPDYFADYDTVVNFISMETLRKDHAGMPHGGLVMVSGETTPDISHTLELKLKLDSNPQFTSSVLLASARAVSRMAQDGRTGAVSMFDVPPAYYSPKTTAELLKTML